MARGLYFTLTTGERVNFAQARYFEIAGGDLLVHWGAPQGGSDNTTFVGGAADVPAIDAFLGEPQDITDITPYNQQRFAQILYAAGLTGLLSNQDLLAALDHAEARRGQDSELAGARKIDNEADVLIAKFETDFP